jgi:hypothetical protein
MENVSPNTEIPLNNETSFFTKIFDYKYLILLIIIIAILCYYYYYYYKPKNNTQILKQPLIQDFIVADINGKVIKISGEQVGEIKVPPELKQQMPQKKVINQKIQQNFEVDSSDENNNIKQHDLTNSELKDITNKLKN